MHKGAFCRFLFYELNISLNSSPSIFSFSINIFATLVNLSISPVLLSTNTLH